MPIDNNLPKGQVPATVYFDETLAPAEPIVPGLDLESLKNLGWAPLRREQGWAWVATSRQDLDRVQAEAAKLLKVTELSISLAREDAVKRFLEHAQDINPGFPPSAGRTNLARTRTYLAVRRSQLSGYRTLLSRGRTGLAMLRTGLALITISLVGHKIFGMGPYLAPEVLLIICGVYLGADGLGWYIPARRQARRPLSAPAQHGPDITVPEASFVDGRIVITRTGPVPGAAEWLKDCERHSPVMRRRFLALERTELAMERTRQAHFRTTMSKSRTGMALVRTGISLAGLGLFFLRMHTHHTDALGLALVIVGSILSLEGLSWYLPDRGAAQVSMAEADQAGEHSSAWAMLLPPEQQDNTLAKREAPKIPPECAPGVWGTTGLALERTLLAERRNVMSRFRTSLACSRTGLAFIRTGANFVAVGLGLLLSSSGGGLGWLALDIAIMAAGLALIADGLFWHLPARRNRWQLPFCECEMEICLPDYTIPPEKWKTFGLSHDRD